MRNYCALIALLLLACGKASPPHQKDPGFGQPGTAASFDLDADLDGFASYWDLPVPSDLRVSADGKPRLSGFPNPRQLPIIDAFKQIAQERRGFPVLPVGYFRFSAALAPRAAVESIPPTADAPVLLLDVDPASPERGRSLPVVVATPAPDDYAPKNLLAIAPRPGFVLAPGRTYAFVVLRSFNDAQGKPLGVPPALDRLRAGQAPDGALGALALATYAPLWATLASRGSDAAQVAAATLFTTGDAVADTASLAAALSQKYAVTLGNLHALPDAPGSDRVCVLAATVTYPQFQKGAPPFNKDGLFVAGDDGLPRKQRDEDAPVVLTLPRQPMSAAGFPLELYFHGSGGASADAIDHGPSATTGGDPQRGRGPAWVLAPFGIATAASALPVNPERLPGAGDTAYLNLANPAALRDTFRQGVIEQRLFLDALLKLSISPSVVAGCTGLSLPDGAAGYRFDAGKVVAQGQSMGGMYTNLISATEPRIRASVPTGAGGYWTYFVLITHLHPGLGDLLALLLDTAPGLTALHPTLALVEAGWEPADPFVSMPRLARRPLPGHPVRPIYEPVGKDDQYFPIELYDAVALSYGHQEAGSVIWPSMQDALKLDSLSGLVEYPVRSNRVSADGTPYTGVVVQYKGDGIEDPHAIYRQLDAVKYQYGCFLSTFLATGTAVVPAPLPLGTPCPQ